MIIIKMDDALMLDHLVIKSIDRRGNVRELTTRLIRFYNHLRKSLRFACDDEYGYLSVNPALLGSGLRVSMVASLPRLANNYTKLKSLCDSYDMIVLRQRQCLFELCTGRQSPGLSQFRLIVHFFNGVREILEYEYSLRHQ